MVRKVDASPSPWRKRQNFSRIQSVVEIPDLIETQQSSYRDFLQEDVVSEKRREMGLQQAFKSIFPIKGRDTSSLDFVSYHLGRPKYKVMECIERGMTYAAPLRIKVRLVIKAAPAKDAEPEVVDIREEDIYLGEIPLMTDRGTFVINGAERVVVSQLHRSPGAVFNVETHHTGQKLITASIIPNRGAWLEFENDLNDVLYVIIDRKRKMPVTILLRAFGYGSDEEIFSLFIERQKVALRGEKKALIGRLLATEIRDPSSEAAVFEAGTEI
ncbi:MAG TPA: DNA-directed RNA polymerase subunit beta, partial [bacterium]|nr:DNA-directed RNA polymerase subunit beta [bacterium]